MVVYKEWGEYKDDQLSFVQITWVYDVKKYPVWLSYVILCFRKNKNLLKFPDLFPRCN